MKGKSNFEKAEGSEEEGLGPEEVTVRREDTPVCRFPPGCSRYECEVKICSLFLPEHVLFLFLFFFSNYSVKPVSCLVFKPFMNHKEPQEPPSPANLGCTHAISRELVLSWQFPDVSSCPRNVPCDDLPSPRRLPRPLSTASAASSSLPTRLTPRQQRMQTVDLRVEQLLREAHVPEPLVTYEDLADPLGAHRRLSQRREDQRQPNQNVPILTATYASTATSTSGGQNESAAVGVLPAPAPPEPMIGVYRPFSRVQQLRTSLKPTATDLDSHPSYRILSEKEQKDLTERALNRNLVEEDQTITGEEIFLNAMMRRMSGPPKTAGGLMKKTSTLSGLLKALGGGRNVSGSAERSNSGQFSEDVDFTPQNQRIGNGTAAAGGSGASPRDGSAKKQRLQPGRVSPNRRSGKVIMYDENEGGLLYDQLSGNVLPFSIQDLLSTNVKLAVAVELTYNRVFTGELLAPFRAIRLARTVLPQLTESTSQRQRQADSRVEDDRLLEGSVNSSVDAGCHVNVSSSPSPSRNRCKTAIGSAAEKQAMACVGNELQPLANVGSDYLKIFRQLQGRSVVSSTQLIRDHREQLDSIVDFVPQPRPVRTTKYRSIFDGFENRAASEAVKEWQLRGSGVPSFRKPNRYGNKWFAPVDTWVDVVAGESPPAAPSQVERVPRPPA